MPARILSIAERHLKNPARITIAHEKVAAGKMPRIRQIAYVVARPHKQAALERVLESEDAASALVFCRTRIEVDQLVEMLNAHGHGAEALHGGMDQRQRDRVMARFRDRTADLLVATDVAARGLDIQRLSHGLTTTCRPRLKGVRPSHRPHRPRRPRGDGDHARRATRAPASTAQHGGGDEAEGQVDRAEPPISARGAWNDARGASRRQLVAGGFEHVRVVVETLAQEFDIVDVAAAAVQLAHNALRGDGE